MTFVGKRRLPGKGFICPEGVLFVPKENHHPVLVVGGSRTPPNGGVPYLPPRESTEPPKIEKMRSSNTHLLMGGYSGDSAKHVSKCLHSSATAMPAAACDQLPFRAFC